MNIAIVITNLRGGGAEKAMIRLASALLNREHNVRLILLEHKIEHEVPAHIHIHTFTSPGTSMRKGIMGKYWAAYKLKKLLKNINWLSNCLIVSTLPFADEVVALAKIPNTWFRIANTLSAEIQAMVTPEKQKRRLQKYKNLYDGKNLIAVSTGVGEDLRKNLGLQNANIVRIYNGFDVNAIRKAAEESEPDIPQQAYIIHAGRFMQQKRHDVLLDAWQKIKQPHLLVLLTQDNVQLREMIEVRGLQDRVLIAGFKSNPYPWIKNAELLVLSSDREGMPNVLVEALACGTRVVSTDCPSGPREVMQGNLARWLAPCGNADALAELIQQALMEPRPVEGSVPEQFTETHMAKAYEALGN